MELLIGESRPQIGNGIRTTIRAREVALETQGYPEVLRTLADYAVLSELADYLNSDWRVSNADLPWLEQSGMLSPEEMIARRFALTRMIPSRTSMLTGRI
jgi:hypothetical protein